MFEAARASEAAPPRHPKADRPEDDEYAASPPTPAPPGDGDIPVDDSPSPAAAP